MEGLLAAGHISPSLAAVRALSVRLHRGRETLPLYEDAEAAIIRQLERLAASEKPPVIVIGCFTPIQFEAINIGRRNLDLHILVENEILFLGRHVFASRTKDGYLIEDTRLVTVVLQPKASRFPDM
jgi:hypothetical protein